MDNPKEIFFFQKEMRGKEQNKMMMSMLMVKLMISVTVSGFLVNELQKGREIASSIKVA